MTEVQSINKTPDGMLMRTWLFLKKFFPMHFLAATAAYCIFLFSLSSVSSFPMSSPFPSFDKLAHFCLYGGLSGIVAMGLLQADRKYSTGTLIIVPVAFCIAYSLSDEIHQLFVESRVFETADIAADIIGASAAALFLLFLKRRVTNRKVHGEGGPK